MIRAFIAVELSRELQDNLSGLISSLRKSITGPLKWVDPRKIHLTLSFLGDVDSASQPLLETIMARTVNTRQSFTINAAGLGCFPNSRNPRVLWCGLTPVDQLRQVQSALARELAENGYEIEDRPFSPHLTLARISGGLEPGANQRLIREIDSSRGVTYGSLTVGAISLIRSVLQPSGAQYSTLATARFKADDV